MPERRLRRFLHLERPRGEDGREGTGAQETGARFAGVERSGIATAPPAAPARTGAPLERFGPEPDPVLELLETEGRRPFTRCARCGMDSGVAVTSCGGCGERLDTPAQLDFNERLWAERQAETEREARAAEERRELQRRAAEEDALARRRMGETLAREVGAAERRRLGLEGGWADEPFGASLAAAFHALVRSVRARVKRRWG